MYDGRWTMYDLDYSAPKARAVAAGAAYVRCTTYDVRFEEFARDARGEQSRSERDVMKPCVGGGA